MQAIVLLCLTISAAQGSPVADPYLLGAPIAPVLYHAPNCTEEMETIKIKSCSPRVEEDCQDVEVPVQYIEYEKECTTFTAPVCKPVLAQVSDEEEGAEKAKRDADPQLFYHPLTYLVAEPKIECEDVEQESCINKPVVKESNTIVKNCQVKTTVECKEEEEEVPRVTCVHALHTLF